MERLNGWAKVLALFIPLVVAGLLAWGANRAEVRQLRADVDRKPDAALMLEQQRAILRELGQINDRLRQLEARP